MNQIFSLEGPIFKLLNKFCDMLFVSLLWLAFSLPVITIGASSCALYHTTHKVICQNEGYVFSTFWKSFRVNLKQGIFLTLLCIPAAVFGVVCYLFANSLPKGNLLTYFYFAIAILDLLLLFIIATYAFPVLSRFYMTTKDVLKNSVALAVTRPGFTLLLIIIFFICAVAFFLIPVSGFLLPACFAASSERLLEPAFKKALDAKATAEKETSADAET